ncbi:gastrula zinc finger protein XlCGF8.2DB-like [Etheostoma cragini]|uniref:gastrula zinc finger protein XlCGF8.2DB-like n=1 Tax=Etheostoma cragini TaxID=417921 RepID=UPI00155EA8BB|nr:gastrula zinc finger protein XlCGF8.2DB-like [Etheostoma cragini]
MVHKNRLLLFSLERIITFLLIFCVISELSADSQQDPDPPHSSSPQPMETERDADNPDSSLQAADVDDETADCSIRADTVKPKETPTGVPDSSKPEAANSGDYTKKSRKPQPGSRTLRDKGVPGVGKGGKTGKKSFSCSQCGRKFEPKGRKRPLVCPACVQRSTQCAHVVTDRTSGVRGIRCSACKKEFSRKKDAVRHVRMHNREKPFSCSLCGKGFTQKSGLRAHMRIHTGEKPYGCSRCPKRFNRSGILARHMRVHTGEKPYGCSVCSTRFTLSQSLLIHMRIHTGEKPFSCSVCDKTFTQKVHLTQHMSLHSGDTPFSCSACGRTFTRQSRVKNHKCDPKTSSS